MRFRTQALAVATALATVATVLAVPTAAAADPPSPPIIHPPGPGSSAYWEFHNDTEWGYRMEMPGAVVSGSGKDTSGHREFRGGVTDLTPDARCAWFTFQESSGAVTVIACNGWVPFTHNDPTPAEYTFTLNLRTTSGSDQTISRMVIPNTKYYPELRAEGMGARWEWDSDDEVDFQFIRPDAVVLGTADGYPNREVDATTFSSNGCARTQIMDDTIEEASVDACATPGFLHEVYADHEFEVRSCLIRSIITITGGVGRPGPTKCVRMLVM
jgi:hypothetical protein